MSRQATSTLAKLRPAKVRSALTRRWFEQQLGALTASGRGGPILLGTDYGGWLVPGDLTRPGWTCWSVGAGGDISFDLELIRHFGVTVRSVEPEETYVSRARETAGAETRFSVIHAAIATQDAPLRMQRTHIPGSRSLSSAKLYDTKETSIEVPGRTLGSLAAELGDDRIDLLKIDIEGAEYDVLPTIDYEGLGVKVLATQLHHNRGVAAARKLIAELEARGFERVAMRHPIKLTFARRDLLG